ncbi:putative short-chain dehydrogenase/reductase [Neurospora tetraspora]|uniref:Short-chain dehydrogenase/reductase n=1 Tax=Neurospora tetraspora TaxID=94610 RepID=A0AAE0JF05_9PEZI|nr:putative short-chain dehydrogenase/reductase [Neurospora tetraspora]
MWEGTVLITGCSEGGIGSAMAKVFAAKGYRVFATLRNSSKGGPSLENTPGIEVLLFDVTSLDSIKQCAAEVQKRTGGKLDVLVNNAGADYVMPLLDVDIDDAKRFYDLNVWSVLGMVQAFAPVLIKAKGVVVNHSSVASVMPLAWAGIYSSSKSAMNSILATLRAEGVRVITAASDLVLPEGSYYQQVFDRISDIRKGLAQLGSMDVNVVPRSMVADIESGKNGVIWRGGTSSLTRYLVWLLPNGLFESLVNWVRGLERVQTETK